MYTSVYGIKPAVEGEGYKKAKNEGNGEGVGEGERGVGGEEGEGGKVGI